MKQELKMFIVNGFRGFFVIAFSIYFFIFPLGILLSDLTDPALKTGDIPQFAFRWHKNLVPKFEAWAIERVSSKQAQNLSLNDVSGTEWPIFSAVYFLWATESLQEAWEQDPTVSNESPVSYSAEAIDAAATLVADPNHADWVKKHWGDDYLSEENIFYRMLLISGLLSYQNLTGNNQYENLLEDQVISLSSELDASEHGLLDDYPGQCYPIDILPAIAVIQRSESLFQTDHSAFVERSLRGFSGRRLDSELQIPAYKANSKTGESLGPARGVGITYMLIWAPEVWPEVAEEWYEIYEAEFWDKRKWLTGVREYAKSSSDNDWGFEIDAGPVVNGYGTAASAFGIGAARANGRIDHAYPLSVEALVFTWPLPNGTLLLTRPLANLSEAPFIGETALLFNFTRQSQVAEIVPPSIFAWPFITYIGLSFYLLFGGVGVARGVNRLRICYQIARDRFSLSHLENK